MSATATHIELMRKLYARQAAVAPTAAEIARHLGTVADPLAGALVELSRSPTPDRADMMAERLRGALRLVQQLRDQMMVEVHHDGR
jgi:type VI protein secretion system component VasF